MPSYRAVFENKLLRGVAETDKRSEVGDIVEDQTGETIYATFEAANDQEAHEKAKRISLELQTGRTKSRLNEGNDLSGPSGQ